MQQRPYISPDGIEYESYEAYCNSPDLEAYEIMLKLRAGTRTPQNESEKRILAQMQEIERSGGQIDFTETPW